MFLIYVLMLACAAGLAAFIYRYDLYHRERWYMVVLAVGLGFTCMWMAGAVEDIFLTYLGISHTSIAAKAAAVSVCETVGRIVMVFTVATIFRSRFTNPLDGLMYGTLGGLGMAIEESLMYLSFAPATAQTLGAEVVRLFAHSLMGGLIGFAVGQWVRPHYKPHPRPMLTIGCLTVALMVHFSWDFIAYQASRAALLRLLPMLLMLALMLVWGGLVAYAVEQLRGNAPASQQDAPEPSPV